MLDITQLFRALVLEWKWQATMFTKLVCEILVIVLGMIILMDQMHWFIPNFHWNLLGCASVYLKLLGS